MGTGGADRVELHARPTARSLLLGGSDVDEVRSRCTAQIAAWLDHPSAVFLTGSCSDALEAAASLVDLGPGDEVVVPAFAFPTAIAPFVARGAAIRFADVLAPSGNVDPASVASRLGPRTRAVVVMHYGGVGAVDSDLLRVVRDGGADLVEDAAHGLFARRAGRPLGTFGRFGALSFHRTKNLSALDGGALIVRDPGDVDAATEALDKGTDAAAFRSGRVSSYDWQRVGGSWRMGEGALRYLAEELAGVTEAQARRLVVAATYERDLQAWAAEVGASLARCPSDAEPPAHLFHLLLPAAEDRPSFVDHCDVRGVEVARHYSSMPATPFGRTLRRPGDRTPVADDLARRLVRIPLHPALTDTQIDRVLDAVTLWRPATASSVL